MNIVAHNLTAMNAQRQFNISTRSKAKSTEKLSSGYRINRAADDAAGLSISEKMRRQIRGLNQGIENTQDGVSLCQVADGALAEVNDMLHRITELSVKSANGTNAEQDRQAIQEEISQILREIDRIEETTKFNELEIFKGPKKCNNASTINHESFIRKSISVLGTPQNLNTGTYQILADENSIKINNDSVDWSNVLDENGNAITLDNVSEGNYSFIYNGISVAFQTKSGATTRDVLAAINNMTFDVASMTTSRKAVSLQSYGLTQGSETERFLSSNGTRYNYSGGYGIKADENGIHVAGKLIQNEFSPISWSSLGIDDLDNAGGKTINFQDPESGVHFVATISDGATKQEILGSLNRSTFYWGYIDMSTTENARLGYSASSLTNTITNTSPSPVTARAVSVNKIYDELFDDLGYTSRTDKMASLKLEISISGSTRDDLKLTLKDTATGNTTELSLYSWDPAIYHYANPSGNATAVFGYNDGAQVRLSMGYSTVNVPADADAISYLGTLGTIATDVIIPSPYYFKYDIGKISQTEYSIDNVIKSQDTEYMNNTVSHEPMGLWIQSGCDGGDGMYLEIDQMNTSILGIEDLDVSTEVGANRAMDSVNRALQKVTANRSKIGAQQNRLEHTIANEGNIVENTTAAESRIRDTDMAKEMVKYSNINILEQAGQAMMAQANQSNQGVLSLLQ